MNLNNIFSGSITFDYPYVLYLFLIFIPIFLYDILSGFGKNKLVLPEKLQKKQKISAYLFRLFIAFSIIALSGPRWGTGYSESEYRRGLDVVFAIDVSRSMDIRDAQTNNAMQTRLERGLSIARESAVSVSSARFAAALGRNRGYLAVPLTYDNETVLDFLEILDGSSMTGRSTNLEALIDTAANAFQNSSPAKKVIVLISDGESHYGIIRNAINRCTREGIIVTTVAVGSDEGKPVSGITGNNESAGEIISRRNAAVMQMAAERTKGLYIDGNTDNASYLLSSHLLSMSQGTGTGSSQNESKQRNTFFIILAIIAYALSKFYPLLSGNMKQGLIITLVFFLFTSCSEGKLLLLEANYLFSRGRYDEAVIPYQKALNFKDSAPYAEYGLGLSLYLLDERPAALNRYNSSGKILETVSGNEHRELRYRNYYNSGIIFFEDEDYVSAANAFKEALRVNPSRVDAKRNLEISLMSIAMEAKREKPSEERSEAREVIFDYLKQQEQQYWKSGEWTNDEQYSENDY